MKLQAILFLGLLGVAIIMQQVGCSSVQKTIPASSEVAAIEGKLSWENGHPERAAWTKQLIDIITPDIEVFYTASDITKIRPDFKTLSKSKQILVIAELFSAMAFYESSWNPKENSVDVGSKNDQDTYSVGLLQMSVVDQKNYGFKFGYTFKDLQQAGPNLKLAEAIMVKQIKRYGKILIPKGENGVYWAVIHPKGKYDKSDKIIAMVRAL